MSHVIHCVCMYAYDKFSWGAIFHDWRPIHKCYKIVLPETLVLLYGISHVHTIHTTQLYATHLRTLYLWLVFVSVTALLMVPLPSTLHILWVYHVSEQHVPLVRTHKMDIGGSSFGWAGSLPPLHALAKCLSNGKMSQLVHNNKVTYNVILL